MYSFSTCWNSHRHTDGRAMLREICELDFEYVELSHGISISLMPGIFEAVNAGEIRISSLHNFCPLPMGITRAAPNLYEFSAEKDFERELAIRYTLKTFEFAEQLKAKAVVLHLGSIELKDYTGRLCDILERDEKPSPKFEKLRAEAVARREAVKGKFIAHMYDTLRKLLPDAEKRGLKLGCENRQALEEIPLESDFALFFRDFASPSVAYWHDFGHAQIKENLGLIQHLTHLESLASRVAGFHIHDVQYPYRDHAAPGTGVIDFAKFKQFIKPEHIKVFELSPGLSVEAVKAGVAHVKRIWGDE